MYVTLLLLAPAVCEWVEISQHHYSRKPTRTNHHQADLNEEHEKTVDNTFQKPFKKPHRHQHSPINDIVTETYEETLISYRKPVRSQYFPADGVTEIYVEDSLSDSSRYRYRKPIRNYITTTARMPEEYAEVTTSFSRNPTRTHVTKDKATEEVKKQNRIYPNQTLISTKVWNQGNVDKVPKQGNVQRIQIDSNAVKAPSFKQNQSKNIVTLDSSEVKGEKNITDDRDLSSTIENTEKTLNGVKAEQLKETQNILPPRLEAEGFKKSGLVIPVIKYNAKTNNIIFNKPTDNVTLINHFNQYNPDFVFITKENVFENTDKSNIHNIDFNFDDSQNKPFMNSRIKIVSTTEKEKMLPNRVPVLAEQIDTKRYNEPTQSVRVDHKDGFNNKTANEFKPKTNFPLDEDYATVHDENEDTSQPNRHNIQDQHHEDKSDSESGEEHEATNETSNDSKSNAIENLMTLMKVVTETIRRNTRRSVHSKTKYLTNLKDTILNNIKERIDSTWPDEPPAAPTPSRVSRAAQASARGHIEIPSSESALMTISFLTFAVFLIKLVLQIIQVYKNKTMMVTPAVVATVGRAAAAAKRSKP